MSSKPKPSRSVATKTTARRAPRPLPAILHVERPQAPVQTHSLSEGSCIIGAGSGVDLVVDDDEVSRKHVELTLVAEGVALRDLGSRNGTYFLGQRLERAILNFGSRIRIGSTDIVIALDPSALAGVPSGEPSYHGLEGSTAPMLQLFAILRRIEGSLVPVLIEGESGTGKELVARAVHAGSAVCDGELVTLNCGAVSKELVRSELFGHRQGAFTGAHATHQGAFEAADGGTLFLDEVGELPLDIQPMLLRALESGEITPVGESKSRVVNARVIAATNRDLKNEVSEGRFREDLYYRLAVVRLEVPPLRDRQADIAALAQAFATSAGGASLPEAIVVQLSGRSWPGNVRELRNAVLSFLAIGTLPDTGAHATSIEKALESAIDLDVPYHDHKDELVSVFSKVYFRKLLLATNGNQSEAARRCGLERNFLRRLLQRYDVE